MSKQTVYVVHFEDHHNGDVHISVFANAKDADVECACMMKSVVANFDDEPNDVSALIQQEKITEAVDLFNNLFSSYSLEVLVKEVL